MTKKMSKFLSMLLAAVMVLSMAMTGLAADGDPEFSITITNAHSGETYSAYKIFDVTYSGDNYAYTIDSSSAWYDIVAAAKDVFTLTQVNGSTTYIVSVNDEASEADVIAVFTDVDITTLDIEPDATATQETITNTDGSSGYDTLTLDVSGSGAGYYFVTTTVGSIVSIDTTNPNAEITDKNDIPTSEKVVNQTSIDNHTQDVTYTLYARNVKDAINLIIHDKMQIEENDGILYWFDYENMSVILVDGANQTELTEGTYYTLSKATETSEGSGTYTYLKDGCDFELAFNGTAETLFSNSSSEAYVMVTISCMLDAGEKSFANDEVEIENGEQVTYGNGGESKWDYADVYEYAFHIYKYTVTNEEEIALAGAKFQLTSTDVEGTAYFTDNGNGTYVLEGFLKDGEELSSDYTTEIVTPEDGKVIIEGLAEGTYTLTETEAPAGYNMLDKPITVTITADSADPSSFTVTQDDESVSEHTVSVENNSGTKLPGTGGMGTTLFYIIGAVLVLGAATLLITKKRLDRE